MPLLLMVLAAALWLHGDAAPRTAAQPALGGTITVDAARPSAAIPRGLYGIFYEEISHAGDGGLYAELVRNRGFEDANLPPACILEDGFAVPPRTPHFDSGRPNTWRLRWDVANPHPAWSLDLSGGGAGAIDLVDERPLTTATPHSLRVTVKEVPARGAGPTLVNEGHWGMAIREGEQYRLSFFARTEGITSVDARLLTSGSASAGGASVRVQPGGWRKYEVAFTATTTDPKARLGLSFRPAGRIFLDMVSLFPAKTFRNRPNGLRPDLAEAIAALKPGFIRGPGGCFAEGITIESRPQWKRSLGPLETRSGTYSPWGYWSTDGFGYHEFLQFAEDIGADALWVVNAGVSCSFRSGTFLPDSALPSLIEDTLEAIEYAIGPVTSTWGARRAAAGHPAPFPLKYIEIGNEQQGARYGERVKAFAAAIKKRYPQIKVALSSWISGIDRAAITAAGPIDIVDEHAYKALNWSVENFDSFASYKREGWDLYIGEFATNSGVGRGNLMAALHDAVYMMSAEKNSDLVKMVSYAPLLENVNKRDWEVNMIHFDSSRMFPRATYYAQKVFAENLPAVNLPASVTLDTRAPAPISGRIGVGTWNTAAEFKDIRVERAGRIVYESDFAGSATGWAPVTGRGQGGRGTWNAVDGAYRQSGEVVAFSYAGDPDWTDVTISMKARKISGAEGFLVLAGTVDGRRVQWNVGGWNNRQTALQATDTIVGRPLQHSVETGRWYDVRVEVRDRTVRGYLDGTLISEATYPRVDTVLGIAGRDDRTGDIIIKVVNTAAAPATMAITLDGGRPTGRGTVTVLTSASPTDENSFETPAKIVPRTSPVSNLGASFPHTFPPYSLSVLRIATK
jgi:alpha-L-arabinofuranosidase